MGIRHRHSSAGFTLLEMIIVLIIIGIISAIAVPSWITFVERQHLNAAQNQIYQAMREAQSNAIRDKETWQASFRETTIDNKPLVQWVIHQANVTPTPQSWQNLYRNIRLDDETTLFEDDGVRRIQFNYYGCPILNSTNECGQTSIQAKGRITLNNIHTGKAKRCVIVSTLLGALRTAKEQRIMNDGKYCY